MTSYNLELKQKLETRITAEGLSQVKAAKLIGISDGALSQYRREKYTGDVAAIEVKIDDWLGLAEEQAADAVMEAEYKVVNSYVATSISSDVYDLLRICHRLKGIMMACGDAGIGKTSAAVQYLRENPANTVYLKVTPSSATLRAFLNLLAKALRIPNGRNTQGLSQDIEDKLRGANKLIIIDEAQHLHSKALEEIRSFAEPDVFSGMSEVGIVFIGNDIVHSKLIGKQQAEFAQLFSRIKMRRHFETKHIQRKDIELMFPLLVDNGDKKSLDFLLSVSQSVRGLRTAVNVYNNAVMNQNVTYQSLFSMYRNMENRGS
jgi:DNA transposition AAA+ family ATPase